MSWQELVLISLTLGGLVIVGLLAITRESTPWRRLSDRIEGYGHPDDGKPDGPRGLVWPEEQREHERERLDEGARWRLLPLE